MTLSAAGVDVSFDTATGELSEVKVDGKTFPFGDMKPVGIKMNRWGRKNTVMLSMLITLVGMVIPLLQTPWACLVGYALLGIGI